MATSLWYSISIQSAYTTENPTIITFFNGYFSVNSSTNLVTSFYETINGDTNFDNNLIVPVGQISWATADNLYQSNWLQFDYNGCGISTMSYYPNYGPFVLTSYDPSGYLTTNQGVITSQYPEPQRGSCVFYITPVSNPISNICFPAKTPITTDQGNIPIQKINPNFHTINGKKIVEITKVHSMDNYLVCFEKDALENNVPSRKTIISKNHEILYNGKRIKAMDFVDQFENVYRVKNKRKVLYNVLMEQHDQMMVNNMSCETLHPENDIAKLYRKLKNLTPEQQQKIIQEINDVLLTPFNISKKNVLSKKPKLNVIRYL